MNRIRFASIAALLSLLGLLVPHSHAQDCAAQAHRVGEIRLINVTLLDAATVARELMAGIRLRSTACVAADGLADIGDQLQQRYAAAGYGAIKVLPPQPPDANGLLQIEVIEGQLLPGVSVFGTTRLTQDSVRASLPALVGGEPVRIRQLDAQLRLANDNPAKETQLVLMPGPSGGNGVQAEIRVRELAQQRIGLNLDNTGDDATGRHRVALSWRDANLSGHDDLLSLQLQVSPAHTDRAQVLSAGYRWPVYGSAMLVDAFAGYSNSAGMHTTTAGNLTLNGRGSVVGLRLTWAVRRWGEIDQRIGVGIDHRSYRNDCAIAGLPEGACGPAGQALALTPLSLEYLAQRGGSLPMAVNLRLQRSLGLGSSSDAQFNAVRAGARADATAARAGASLLMPFADDWQAVLRSTGQVSRHAMVSGEMFGAGGVGSVRGYRERELTGDHGLDVSVQFGRVGLLTPQTGAKAAVNLYGFADAAVLQNRTDLECLPGRTRCVLAAWGIGTRATWGNWSAGIDLAHALRAGATTPRGDTRVHFSLATHFDR